MSPTESPAEQVQLTAPTELMSSNWQVTCAVLVRVLYRYFLGYSGDNKYVL